MRISLVLTGSFESTYNGKHYYIYQFVDPQTLTILSYSTEKELSLSEGQAYECKIAPKGTKNGQKLAVSEILPSK